MSTTPSRAQRDARRQRTQARRRRQATMLMLVPLILAAALALPACGSDGDDDAKASVPKTTTTTEAPKADAVIEVHAVDYAFNDLPEKVKAGTRLTLVNDAAEEPHELVAIKLPDDEKRSVEDLLALPEAEVEALMGAGPPAMVLLAAPGKPEIKAVGDGVLTEKGRYLVMCSIPEGSDASILEGADGPPEDTGMPPHFAHGMHAELTVE